MNLEGVSRILFVLCLWSKNKKLNERGPSIFQVGDVSSGGTDDEYDLYKVALWKMRQGIVTVSAVSP